MLNALFLLAPDDYPKLYSDEVRARLEGRALILGGLVPSAEWTEHRDTLSKTDIIFSGWGAPVMDDSFLQAAPRLKAVFYAGGSVRYFVTDAFWQRKIRVTSALSLNAIPVSEYTVSVILLGLKRFWHYAHQTRVQRNFQNGGPIVGAYRSTVGLVSYGRIARLVRQRLLDSDVRVLVYDPFLTETQAKQDRVELASLDDVFSSSDAVSLHAPLREETTGLITGRHFERMKQGALFINTARGEIVNEAEMISSLRHRPDLQAVLDVTSPEPPAADSPLYQLSNVVLTPHIAGSLGSECRRMGHAMVDEFERFLRAEPLLWELTADMVAVMA
jgi:phosphoglycerate dehydrogenase-like enzyme